MSSEQNGLMKDAMLDVVRQALSAELADVMPRGFEIYLVAEYDPERFPAPNLWLEKREKPNARYVAILVSDTDSVPALGETVADAVKASIAKIESLNHAH